MALLDMARKEKIYIEVAHVNYHKRDTALRDQKIVKRYCDKYSIIFHLLNVKPNDVKGNFQSYARNARYKFFKEICNKRKLNAVLVAHHKDDHLETYLMQKQKKIGVSHYGLASNAYVCGNNVIRPLLSYSKNDLLFYCINNNIQYGIDESNNTDHYTRNKIRHSLIDKMSDDKKNKLLIEIENKNIKLENDLLETFSYLSDNDTYDVKYFLSIPHITLYLRMLFGSYSDSFYSEMLRQIKTAKTYKYHKGIYYICKEYNTVSIFIYDGEYEYKYKNYNELVNDKNSIFKIKKKGKVIEGVNINKNDFPIYIRSYKPGDQILLRFGTKKINRFFIDNKIAYKDRLNWPIMVNKNNTAIFVPKIGCDISHYSAKPNIYMVKL